ncbi:MAG: N5-carboxyaminoimidazole ribonucleotide synthase [Chitinophagales bacterium]|nr:MAG: N5-carboxyaminoimidazole ribonucleotide synthase [Chitinophagales bacterium]
MSIDKRIGILGGGQLGRMLIQAAINYNLDIAILDPDPEAPCRSLAGRFFQGNLLDYDTVYNFGKQVDVLTIEIEHVNTDALFRLEEEGVKVFPRPASIRMIQDKGFQKQFYKENGIPTSEFRLCQSRSELAEHQDFLPFFQKLRRGGYDGRGVQQIRHTDDFSKAFDAPSVIEKAVYVEKEISVIVARNAEGSVRTYPAVELAFHPEANLVEYLFSPASISPEMEEQAAHIATQVAHSLNLVGLLAVEFFVSRKGELLVNEMAPRVHNSGHHTIEANITSQFEQHLRAILNLPLGSTAIKLPAVMINLLGEPDFEGPARYQGLEQILKMDGVSVHLYGKKITRPFRKMGHVTIVDKDLSAAKEKAKFVKHTLKVIA